jgi:hypothetical protein
MDRAHVGSGTVAVAVGLLVECNPVVAPSLLTTEHLHVVGYHRRRHNTVRVDTLGVTSMVRALNLRPKLYHRLLAHFRSTGVKLFVGRRWCCGCSQVPCASTGGWSWSGTASRIAKRGKKMPAVSRLALRYSNVRDDGVILVVSGHSRSMNSDASHRTSESCGETSRSSLWRWVEKRSSKSLSIN